MDKKSLSAEQGPKFAFFELTYDDDAFGEDLPVAAAYRLDAGILSQLKDYAARIESGEILSVKLNVSTDSVRWIGKLAFDTLGAVAAIPGWFDPEHDDVVYVNDVQNLDMDGDRVDFDDACSVYEGAPIQEQGFSLQMHEGSVRIGAFGATPDFYLNSTTLTMQELERAIEESGSAVEAPPRQRS